MVDLGAEGSEGGSASQRNAASKAGGGLSDAEAHVSKHEGDPWCEQCAPPDAGTYKWTRMGQELGLHLSPTTGEAEDSGQGT